ncbi:unnamed protein product [Auanema sp. JU1783]|nr:unnamed protein product [Auanema sp. JU1783]
MSRLSTIFLTCMLAACAFLMFLPSTSARPKAGYMCANRKWPGGENCLIVNMLRDPHQINSWNGNSWRKAINQMVAYQQLFQEDER